MTGYTSIKKAEAESKSVREEIEGSRSAASEASEAAKHDAEQASGFVEQSQAAFQNCESLSERCEAEKQSCETAKVSAGAAKQEIDGVLENARKLKEQVDSYEATFEAFQESLDERNQQFQDGSEEQSRLFKALKEIETEIQDKNKRADDMLGGATVAGLASSFGTTRNELNQELRNARRIFYGAVFVLIILASPMILYIMPQLPAGGPPVDQTDVGFSGRFAEVLARTVILLPGIWFATFASRRHSSLFRLREHYQFKYNMAASVEGFKHQAKEYASAIAGTTYYEVLTRNPADVMDGHDGAESERPSSPLMEALMKCFKRAESGKETAQK